MEGGREGLLWVRSSGPGLTVVLGKSPAKESECAVSEGACATQEQKTPKVTGGE